MHAPFPCFSDSEDSTLKPEEIEEYIDRGPWDWVRYVTPEGEPYHYAASRHLATTSNIYEGTTKQQIEDQADGILDEMDERRIKFAFDWDWKLAWIGDDEMMLAEFVNHSELCKVVVDVDGETCGSDAGA